MGDSGGKTLVTLAFTANRGINHVFINIGNLVTHRSGKIIAVQTTIELEIMSAEDF